VHAQARWSINDTRTRSWTNRYGKQGGASLYLIQEGNRAQLGLLCSRPGADVVMCCCAAAATCFASRHCSSCEPYCVRPWK